MTFIIKNPSSKTGKGIIIFTHNEVKVFLQYFQYLKPYFFFIQHVQFNIPVPRYPKIDLYMMPKYNYSNPNTDIPMATHVLIDKAFYFKKEDKINKLSLLFEKYNIDKDFISKETDDKPIDIFYNSQMTSYKFPFETLNKLIPFAEKGKKIVFLVYYHHHQKQLVNKFYNKYNSLNSNIKKNILIINADNIKTNQLTFGLDFEEIAILENNSKIFIHGAENEGGCRAIHEAICCGCYLFVKDNLKGGGLDNLPQNGYTLYNYNNFDVQLNNAFLQQKKYICKEKNIQNISSIYTFKKLMKHFYEKLNYKCPFEDFIKESKNEMLQLNIAGHNKNVLWVKENGIDAQIVHNYQISKFKLYIDNAIKLIK